MGNRLLVLLGCLAVVACSKPQFEETNALRGAEALACVAIAQPYRQQCDGRSVVLTGFTIDNAPGGYRLSGENPANGEDPGDADDFIAVYDGTFRPLEGKVRVKGVVRSRGFFTPKTFVAITEAVPEDLTKREAALLSQRQSEGYKTPEQRIAEARKEGIKALEEADAAIRANNADMKRALASKAVAHHVRNSGDTLIDVYQMRDGRIIGCKTVVYPSSAPITTCDGEP